MHRMLMKPATIYLVRHAESVANKNGNVIGDTEARLTREGRMQARKLRNYLSAHPIGSPIKVFSSNMPRAASTADIIASGLGVRTDEIIRDPRLREIARGDWDGKPRDLIYTPALQAEMASLDMDHRAPNGESMNDKAMSMRQWVFDLNQYVERGMTMFLAVSHGVAIKSLLQRIFGVDPRLAWLIGIDNTSVTKIRCSANGWHLDYLNATPHLPERGF